MGGLSSFASTVGQVGQFLGTGAQLYNQGEQLYGMVAGNTQQEREQAFQRDQLRRAQQADMDSFSADVARRRSEIKTTADIEERRRVDALRRAMAKSRALTAANGIDPSDGGSGEAILLGQINDTELDRKDAQTIDRLKEKAIDDSIADKNRRNLLEAADLYERQKLQNLRW